jgi:hypothetical protein
MGDPSMRPILETQHGDNRPRNFGHQYNPARVVKMFLNPLLFLLISCREFIWFQHEEFGLCRHGTDAGQQCGCIGGLGGADNSNDLVSLAQILGHENLNTTARYTKRTNQQLADGVEKTTF